jgi:hypothetical protein
MNGIIQAPNISDSGITTRISSSGENNERPINRSIDPIIICFIFSPYDKDERGEKQTKTPL